MYSENDYRDYLAHHGILGMKWGIRHDRYPLSANQHTASEKKAGWRKSLFGSKKKAEETKTKSSKWDPEAVQKHVDEMVKTAEETGKYDMNFMEIIQNESDRMPKEMKLREYKNYLTDPSDYAFNYDPEDISAKIKLETLPAGEERTKVAREQVKRNIQKERDRNEGKTDLTAEDFSKGTYEDGDYYHLRTNSANYVTYGTGWEVKSVSDIKSDFANIGKQNKDAINSSLQNREFFKSFKVTDDAPTVSVYAPDMCSITYKISNGRSSAFAVTDYDYKEKKVHEVSVGT